MNTALWKQIEAFDLEQPFSEYGFALRLAKENYWTSSFTSKAIREYKKFMYLAATSDAMVSPSRVVDAVWHQHLTFTQSYGELCAILGKTVQHIPSNRSAADRRNSSRQKHAPQSCIVKRSGVHLTTSGNIPECMKR